MNLSVVILAAGLGKRMNSAIPKVLHETLGQPMLQHVINAVKPLNPAKIVVVIGNGAESVKKAVNHDRLTFVMQRRLIGTGNAVAIARKELKKGPVLILNGDGPLITTKTLKALLGKHTRNKNRLSFLTFVDNSMSGYGRIFMDKNRRVTGIVEDTHTTLREKKRFTELNGGTYVIDIKTLNFLNRIKKNSSSGEYYLTDLVSILSKAGEKLEAYKCHAEEVRGVNNRQELYEVSSILKARCISRWMKKGVTFLDPDTAFLHSSVLIGKDTIIYPNTYLEGTTSIGRNCTIYPGARIYNSKLGNGVTIKDNTLIEESIIKDRAIIGPCAHLRPHNIVGSDAKIGNFVELKKTIVGNGTKASHLSYIGDAEIEENVNIGAGTITCNYDGRNKFKTKIKKGVFIGSDSQLIAPVTIGEGAYVAAGTTVTKDIPSKALAISRVKQQNLPGWANRRKAKSVNKK